MTKSGNPVVQNAIAANDMVGASAWLAGAALSQRLSREAKEKKEKAKGNVNHAIRDLNGAFSMFETLYKNGDPTARAACDSISQSVGLLTRLLTS